MKKPFFGSLLAILIAPGVILAQTGTSAAPRVPTTAKPALAAPVTTADLPKPPAPATTAAPATTPNPPAHPIQVTVACDKTEYMHGQPGVQYVMAPTGTLKATLVIKNTTTSLHLLTFNTSQKYDFVIRDAQGKEVKRWSADRMFAQIVTTTAIKPGEELSFAADLPLGDSGKPLPAGSYTLEGLATYTADAGDPSSPPLPANMDARTSPKVAFKIIPTPAK